MIEIEDELKAALMSDADVDAMARTATNVWSIAVVAHMIAVNTLLKRLLKRSFDPDVITVCDAILGKGE